MQTKQVAFIVTAVAPVGRLVNMVLSCDEKIIAAFEARLKENERKETL